LTYLIDQSRQCRSAGGLNLWFPNLGDAGTGQIGGDHHVGALRTRLPFAPPTHKAVPGLTEYVWHRTAIIAPSPTPVSATSLLDYAPVLNVDFGAFQRSKPSPTWIDKMFIAQYS
jgi:hypothetical protein